VVKVLVSSLNPALSPTIYRSMKGDRALHAKVFRLFSTWIWGLSLWLALCTSLGAQSLTALVFGQRFTIAAPAMAVLAWSLPMTALAYAMADFFVAAGKQAYSMHVWAAAVLTNVTANLLLTYEFGMVGAAASMVVSSGAFCATQVFLAHTRLGLHLEWGKMLLLGLSCGIASCVGHLLLVVGATWSVLVATGLYFGLATCFGAVGWREVHFAKRFVTGR
jgi:O-antigen/teichoic acid export membrane protein